MKKDLIREFFSLEIEEKLNEKNDYLLNSLISYQNEIIDFDLINTIINIKRYEQKSNNEKYQITKEYLGKKFSLNKEENFIYINFIDNEILLINDKIVKNVCQIVIFENKIVGIYLNENDNIVDLELGKYGISNPIDKINSSYFDNETLNNIIKF